MWRYQIHKERDWATPATVTTCISAYVSDKDNHYLTSTRGMPNVCLEGQCPHLDVTYPKRWRLGRCNVMDRFIALCFLPLVQRNTCLPIIYTIECKCATCTHLLVGQYMIVGINGDLRRAWVNVLTRWIGIGAGICICTTILAQARVFAVCMCGWKIIIEEMSFRDRTLYLLRSWITPRVLHH